MKHSENSFARAVPSWHSSLRCGCLRAHGRDTVKHATSGERGANEACTHLAIMLSHVYDNIPATFMVRGVSQHPRCLEESCDGYDSSMLDGCQRGEVR